MTQAKLKIFGQGLAAVCRAYHYRCPENTKPGYVVWQELSGNSVAGDNRHSESLCEIAVDYFTKTEFDAVIDDIEAYLQDYGSWRLESVQFETDTGVIHYEWRLEYA